MWPGAPNTEASGREKAPLCFLPLGGVGVGGISADSTPEFTFFWPFIVTVVLGPLVTC